MNPFLYDADPRLRMNLNSHDPARSLPIRHIQDAETRDRPISLLPDHLYSLVLDAIVITCVDIIFTHRDQIFLGKRHQPPRPGWWMIGGRMFPGESPAHAAQRKAKFEANLELDPHQFIFFGVYSTCFATRAQPPHDHGLHSVNLTCYARLTEADRNHLHLTATEYDDSRWFDPSELPTYFNTSDPMDRFLLQILDDLNAQLSRDRPDAL